MSNFFQQWSQFAASHTDLNGIVVIILLAIVAFAANWITKMILLRAVRKVLIVTIFHRKGIHKKEETPLKAIERLSNIVPAIIVFLGVSFIPNLPPDLVVIVRNVCNAFMVLTIAMAIGAVLDWIHVLYDQRPDAKRRPIKGFIQIAKIVIYAIAAILIIASLMNRSPLILLSGLGAMAAVLMLIFQSTILSLVASIQLTTTDMLRVGDWISMPNLNIDGVVIDMMLHTVRVQNWDNTISTVPTSRLISDSFKNWRGMSESGGRRICRSLFIDQQSVHFLSENEIKRLEGLQLLGGYLHDKKAELGKANEKFKDAGDVNRLRLTNLGTFRAYVFNYLQNLPRIHKSMTLMVRQLDPTPNGLPLQVYCFTNTTVWEQYEGIQADIFDHLFAIIPEFDLRVFQAPTGADVREIGVKAEG